MARAGRPLRLDNSLAFAARPERWRPPDRAGSCYSRRSGHRKRNTHWVRSPKPGTDRPQFQHTTHHIRKRTVIMIVPPTPVVPRRTVIPESPIIPTLPVLASWIRLPLLEVDRCEFRRARVRCRIKALCLNGLAAAYALPQRDLLVSRGLGWLRRSLKLGLPGWSRRGLARFRRSLNLGLPETCGRGLAWFRRSLNLGLSGCCRRGLGWFRRSLNLGRPWLLWSWPWLVSSLFEPGLVCLPAAMLCAAGAARSVGAGFFFSCCAPWPQR